MSVAVAPAPNCLAVDTNFKLSQAALDALRVARPVVRGAAQAVRGIARYVALHEPESLSDITPDEIQRVMAAGFGLWLVQHVRNPGWVASAELGRQLGQAALDNAKNLNVPPGWHLAMDIEGVGNAGEPVMEFVNAWAGEVAAMFAPMAYVGYDNGLTALQWYQGLPNVHRYWKAPGPWGVAVRGFAIEQEMQISIGGVPYDPDVVGADSLGGRLQWMVDQDAVNARFPGEQIT